MNHPNGMYPVWLFHPNFQTIGHYFPAHDAWVLHHLAQKAAQRPNPRFAEIGTFVGTTATILAAHAPTDCFDTWSGGSDPDDEINPLFRDHDIRGAAATNLFDLALAGRATLRDRTPDCLPPQTYDLIFIDADHSYEAVARDIREARAALKPGGILCGHDLAYFPGVTKAVLEIMPVNWYGTLWWKVLP